MRLAANDDGAGIQKETITNVDTINKIALPLLNSITEGVVGTWVVTLQAKTHTTSPTSIDLELLMHDAPDDQDSLVDGGSSKTIDQALAVPLDAATGDPLTKEESLIHVSFASSRTFNTLGTAGSLGLIIRINGGTGVDYDFLIRVNGKALRST